MGVNEGHEAVELHEGVLEGSGRKEKLLRGGKGGTESLGVLVFLLVDVAEAVGFIEDNEIPGNRFDLLGFTGGKLIARD